MLTKLIEFFKRWLDRIKTWLKSLGAKFELLTDAWFPFTAKRFTLKILFSVFSGSIGATLYLLLGPSTKYLSITELYIFLMPLRLWWISWSCIVALLCINHDEYKFTRNCYLLVGLVNLIGVVENIIYLLK